MKLKPEIYRALLTGIQPKDLGRFFVNSKKKLILAKEKVQNLPKDPIKCIVAFNNDAQQIFFAWLSQNITYEKDTRTDEEIISYIKNISDSDIVDVKTELKSLYLQLIMRIVTSKDPHNIIEKLNNSVEDPKPQAPENDIANTSSIMKQICQIALGEEIEKDLIKDAEWGAFIDGIYAIRNKDIKKLTSVLEKIDTSSASYKQLLEYKEKLAVSQYEPPPAKGLIVDDNTEYAPETLEVGNVEWVCYSDSRMVSQSTAFLNVIGYLNRDNLITVPMYQLEVLLPNEGRVIAHSNRITGHMPQPNELGVWKVELFDTEKSIKVTAKTHTRDIFEVIEIPFPSNDPDNVRHWLQDSHITLANKPIFLLSDDILIKPTKDQLEIRRINFQEPFIYWTRLHAFKYTWRSFVIGKLPLHQGYYHCEEPVVTLKRALRLAIENDKLPKLTAMQLQQFIQFISEQANTFDPWQVGRITNIIKTGFTITNNIQDIVSQLLQLEEIKSIISQQKEKILEDYKNNQTQLKADIERLNKEKKILDISLQETKRSEKQLAMSLTQTINKSFEEAKQKGLETLASAALFQVLLGQNLPVETPLLPVNNNSKYAKIGKTTSSFQGTLRALGFKKGDAKICQNLIEIAIKHDFIISFKGFSAEYLGQSCASNLAKKEILSIETTLDSQPDELLSLANDNSWDCAIVNFVNKLPLDVLGAKLETLCIARWLGNETFKDKAILSTISDLDSAFPISDRYHFMGPIIDIQISLDVTEDIPDLYEALSDLTSASIENCQIPEIWIRNIVSTFKCAIEENPSEEKRIRKFIQNYFIPKIVINALKEKTNN